MIQIISTQIEFESIVSVCFLNLCPKGELKLCHLAQVQLSITDVVA